MVDFNTKQRLSGITLQEVPRTIYYIMEVPSDLLRGS